MAPAAIAGCVVMRLRGRHSAMEPGCGQPGCDVLPSGRRGTLRRRSAPGGVNAHGKSASAKDLASVRCGRKYRIAAPSSRSSQLSLRRKDVKSTTSFPLGKGKKPFTNPYNILCGCVDATSLLDSTV